jgi:dTDP-4-dehydrorhamnose reductase
MRILLTGASGLVGSAFARAAARRGHAVVGLVGSWRGGAIEGLTEQRAADLADSAAAQAVALDVFPEAIVNTAAVAEPAACAAQPALAEKLNVDLAAVLAQVAHHVSAPLVHVSTDQVFDGTRAPYAAGDPPAPLNLYGRQKAEAERRVLAAAPEFARIVRSPLLVGNSLGGSRSLHEKLFETWAAGRPARLYTDELRQICSAENLAEVLLELVERPDLRGLFHWAGADLVSRHEIGRRVAAHFKLPATLVVPMTRADTPEVSASRPANLAMTIAPLASRLKTRPQRFDEALEELAVPPPCRAWYHAQ